MASHTRVEGDFVSAKVGASAIAQYARCKYSSGALVVAGLTEYGDVIAETGGAAGAVITARFTHASGEQYGIAAVAIAAGETLYSAADGKVSKTKGTDAVTVGKAVDAAAEGAIVKYIGRTVI